MNEYSFIRKYFFFISLDDKRQEVKGRIKEQEQMSPSRYSGVSGREGATVVDDDQPTERTERAAAGGTLGAEEHGRTTAGKTAAADGAGSTTTGAGKTHANGRS